MMKENNFLEEKILNEGTIKLGNILSRLWPL